MRLVALSKFDEFWIPRFEPLHCMQPECKQIIRGSMFTTSSHTDPAIICEDCYRRHYYGKETYVKAYKHCILADTIHPEASRKMCRCKEVPHFDGSGRAKALFPVDKAARHINVRGVGTVQCTLLKLGELVALAKYEGMQSIIGSKKKEKLPNLTSKVPEGVTNGSPKTKPGQPSGSTWKLKQMRTVTGTSKHDDQARTASSSTTSVVTEAQADSDIPLFFRKYTARYPFGPVHMALRIGPVVIENGVTQ